MTEAYYDFASVYDRLMDNIPYDDWFTYLHALLTEHGVTAGIVAELGCGTGNMTERLAAAGYDMIGIDNAPAMLNIANAKKTDAGSGSLYLCQDMRNFELFGTVAAVVSVCDSINYITDTEDLLTVFRLVNNYLDTDGIFVFDFHTRYYYKEIVADATIAEDRETISFIWDNYFDGKNDIQEICLSLFLQSPEDETLYRKYEEFHTQRGYTLADMQALVEQSGLLPLAYYDAFTHMPATEESERVYVVAREHTTDGQKKQTADAFARTDILNTEV